MGIKRDKEREDKILVIDPCQTQQDKQLEEDVMSSRQSNGYKGTSIFNDDNDPAK